MHGLFEILPRRFVVPTTVGNYSPDWALVVEPRRARGANPDSATLESSDRTCSVRRGSRRGRSACCQTRVTHAKGATARAYVTGTTQRAHHGAVLGVVEAVDAPGDRESAPQPNVVIR
jgi:hypothetical protein